MIQEETRQRPRRCTATRQDGQRCRAWAVPASDPPRCGAHGGGKRRVGAPKGNTNALKHGFYAGKPGFYAADPAEVTIDDAIAGLVDKMTRLDEIIARTETNGEYIIRLFELYTQASSRLSRLLRDRRALSGEASDGIAGAIAQAMDELGTELGVNLK
jgi:hypothetical protein